MRFRNRREAGRALADRLSSWANRPGLQVLALPRGRVPVGYEVKKHTATAVLCPPWPGAR